MGYRKIEYTDEQLQAMRADGLTNAQIAERCNCSVARIYQRIGGKKKYAPRKGKQEQVTAA